MAATTHALEAKAVKASSTSSTTNNTTTNITVNNYLNLSQEHVKKVLTERLNYNVVYAGQAGLATFVFDNILKDLMSKGIKIGVVSNKHHYLVKKLVTHFFPKIIYYSGMKESIHIKPKPDMLLAMI
jgi:phosphoglycolate phosphatase-like HAD superfamily hydrolase